MVDITKIKLGKKPPKIDPRTLKLSKYTTGLPTPPASMNWTQGLMEWGMMLNGPNTYGNGVPADGLGDCTSAAVAHGVQVATLNHTPIGIITPSDWMVLELYENSCGYILGNENTDQGGVIVDVLNYTRQNRPWLHRKKYKRPFQLYAYADTNPGDIVHVKQAIQYFGTVNIGLQLPISAQSQVGGVWDVVGNPKIDPNSQPGSWGGHSVIVCSYDETTLTCITWGMLQKISYSFWNYYTDESHALLFYPWIEKFSVESTNILTQLEADLQAVTN